MRNFQLNIIKKERKKEKIYSNKIHCETFNNFGIKISKKIFRKNEAASGIVSG